MKKHTAKEDFRWSGIFLSAIIQEAYNQGENNFFVDIDQFEDDGLHYVGGYLAGTKDNPLRVHFKDYIGHMSCEMVSYCEMHFYAKDLGFAGWESKHSSFYLYSVEEAEQFALGGDHLEIHASSLELLPELVYYADNSKTFILQPDGSSSLITFHYWCKIS